MTSYTHIPIIDWHQISYTLTGFDRPNFVSDIAKAVPQGDTCQIARLSFVGDGVQARGQLTLRMSQQRGSGSIQERLRAVRGMVSVQTEQQTATA